MGVACAVGGRGQGHVEGDGVVAAAAHTRRGTAGGRSCVERERPGTPSAQFDTGGTAGGLKWQGMGQVSQQ